MKTIRTKKYYFKVLLYCCLIILVLALLAYGLFVYCPKKILADTLAEFEKEFRMRDMKAVSLLISDESILKKTISNKEVTDGVYLIFLKFEEKTVIVKAWPGKFEGHFIIDGSIKKRAKIDGKYRQFPLATIIFEGGRWKILQFGFPDLIDY